MRVLLFVLMFTTSWCEIVLPHLAFPLVVVQNATMIPEMKSSLLHVNSKAAFRVFVVVVEPMPHQSIIKNAESIQPDFVRSRALGSTCL